MKRLIICLICFLFIVPASTSLADYKDDVVTGNTLCQKGGDAVFVEGDGVNYYNHAGIYYEVDGKQEVIEVQDDMDEVIKKRWLYDFKKPGQDKIYFGAHSHPEITDAQRVAIQKCARKFYDNKDSFEYTAKRQINWCNENDECGDGVDGWNGTIEDLKEIRCDGLVEVCYELSGLGVWGKDQIESNYLIQDGENADSHNNAPNWPTEPNPATEICPVVQRGGYGQEYTKLIASDASLCLIDPVIDIKANGSDGPISVDSLDNLSIELSLDPGAQEGADAEWFIAASVPGGDIYSKTLGGWEEGIILITEMPLLDFENLSIEMKPYPDGLGNGTYIFYFAVDTVIDGALSGELDTSLFFDWVEVAVQGVQTSVENIAGTWVWLQDNTNDEVFMSLKLSFELNLTQTGDQIAGTYVRTLELYECCGPVQLEEGEVSGEISGNTVTLNYTVVSGSLDECVCTGGGWTASGKTAGDTFTFPLKLDGNKLLFPKCFFTYEGDCMEEPDGFIKFN